ncbi:MAG: DUF6265 family protein [candidate division Zixibacteria bacterium]|nr:DUF6265 family protein [candidate division Zixibacteria bacterium]
MIKRLVMATVVALCALPQAVISDSAKDRSLNDLAWLAGSWERMQKNSVMRERWKIVDDTLMAGDAIKISGADTTTLERMKMLQRDSIVYFVAEVPHNDSAIYFPLTYVDSLGYHFENPQHDFPTHIVYRQISPDSLHARIEGSSSGKVSGVDFRFRKLR